MVARKQNSYIILSLALFFGWLLSFPFYGPVLSVATPGSGFRGLSLPFIFSFSHACTFLAGGLFLRNHSLWKKLMAVSLIVTIAAYFSLLFLPQGSRSGMMVVMGASSAFYILGWSYPYSMFIIPQNRMKLMAVVIIGSNMFYIVYNYLSQLLPAQLLLILTGIPLLLALPVVKYFPAQPAGEDIDPGGREQSPFSISLMLIICFFIAGLYLCSGFMYLIMQPSLTVGSNLFVYFRYIPYVAVLGLMWYFGDRLKDYFSVYMGVSLLGLAFVSFALIYESTAGLLITVSLVEGAYAFLDLFVWTLIGTLAFIYGRPFRLFGFALSAMIFSIISGDLISAQLLQIGENYRLVTALFAAGSIFLTFSVIPWLNERMNKDLQELFPAAQEGGSRPELNPKEKAESMVLEGQKLTPRETEIIALLLEGLTNREIAQKLYISENTLKTHLKHTYPKFGVKRKRELLSLIVHGTREKLFFD